MTTIFILLVLFQIKHFIADYPAQGRWMLRKFRGDWGFFLPLLAHASVQAFGTLLIVSVFRPELWWLAIVDLVLHFLIDRLKAGPRYFGRYSDHQTPVFWYIIGADQMLHHLAHYGFIYLIAT